MLLILSCLKLSFTTLSLLVILYEPALELFCTNLRKTFYLHSPPHQTKTKVSHVHLTAEFVLFFTGAAHPGVAGEEERIKDWHGDHEFTTGMHLLSLFYIPIMQVQQELGNHMMAATKVFLVSGSMLCFSNLL
jgi:hypothetical protein